MRHRPVIFMLLVLFVSWLTPGGLSMAKDPKRMAILPFTMNADRDLTFLQEGITDMLTSRLAWKGEVEVLEKGIVKGEVSKVKGPLSRETALAIGKNLKVDYVVVGSLTVFGDSVSIDAKIMDVAKADELVTAFNQAKGMDAVIPTVTQFAQDINEKVMGRPSTAPVRAAQQEGPKGPGGLLAEGQAFEGQGVSFTQGIRAEIIGLDVGDVDGDGKTEVVMIDTDTVYIYKWKEKGLVQAKAVKERWATGLKWVSVGDMDGNGKAEIYVTNAMPDNVTSFVLEWDGKDFRKIADGQRWFFRITDIPGRGKSLLGQRRRAGGVYSGEVEFLKRQGSEFVSDGPVGLHPQANIYNFALVDFDGSGKTDTVLLNSSEYLVLYEKGTEEIWRSEDQFGGTYTFLEQYNPTVDIDHIFLPSPIFVTDVDADGKKEVMVCRNIAKLGGRLFDKWRDFGGGVLNFMVRDEAGLTSKFNTKRLGGAMVGYQIADVDGDNLPELVIVSVIKEERLLGKPRSRMVVYDLK